MHHILQTLEAGNSLTAAQVGEAAAFLVAGNESAAAKAAFLRALAKKGETPAEIAAFV